MLMLGPIPPIGLASGDAGAVDYPAAPPIG